MSQAQLDRLLAIQDSRRMSLVEILVQQSVLVPEQVDQELAEFRREMERKNVVITRRIVGPPHAATPVEQASLDDAEADYFAMMI
jgi:hypothetical protein